MKFKHSFVALASCTLLTAAAGEVLAQNASSEPLSYFSYCTNGTCRLIDGQFFARARNFPVNLNVTCKNNKQYALTFDDGPSANYPRLLEVLKRNNVKATFFVVGSNLEKEEKVAWFRQAVADGHFMANHTYNHNDLTKLDADGIIATVNKTSEAMINAAYPNANSDDENKKRLIASSKFIRPPFGNIPMEVYNVLQSNGNTTVRWNADRYDWDMPGSDPQTTKTILARVRQQLDFIDSNVSKGTEFNQSIMDLNHDWQPTTVDAIDELIALVKSRGYEFVTMDVCLGTTI